MNIGLLATCAMMLCSATGVSRAADASDVTITGDLRYRVDGEWLQGADRRIRHRIRARIGAKSMVTDDLALGFRLASGSADPTSTNQTLDGGFSTKAIGLDLAYATWKGGDGSLALTIGKMKNPLLRVGGNQIAWDGDVTPEGVAANYAIDAGFVNCAMLWVDEMSSGGDLLMYTAQAGPRLRMGESAELVLGAGYTHLTGDPYLGSDWGVVEGFAEFSIEQSESRRLSFYGDAYYNQRADDDQLGWIAGFGIKDGALGLGYSYRRVELNAVPSVFSDSDFAQGATDAAGHVVAVAWKFARGVSLNGTFFLNDIGLTNSLRFKRSQINAMFAF